jgi:hypothetical protein
MAARRRKQEEREAHREQQEHGFSGADTEVDHLDVDIAVVVVPVVVMVAMRTLHGAVEAMGIDMRVHAAQRRDQGRAGDE